MVGGEVITPTAEWPGLTWTTHDAAEELNAWVRVHAGHDISANFTEHALTKLTGGKNGIELFSLFCDTCNVTRDEG